MPAFEHNTQDDYAILGIAPGATQAEIKQAFRRLAQQYHPDLNPDNPAAAATFQKISAAYEALRQSHSDQHLDTPVADPVNSSSPWRYYRRAMEQKDRRDYPGAVAELDRAIAADTDFLEAYLERLQLRYLLLNDRGVLEDCQQVLRLNPESVTAHYWLGRSRQRLGYVDSAISAYSRVIELQPDYASAHYRRGLAHRELDEWQSARQDLQRAAELFRDQKDFPRYYQVEAALEELPNRTHNS